MKYVCGGRTGNSWFLIRNVPLRDEEGNVLKWYGSGVEIEDRKRAEQERQRLHQLEADLAHINRVSMMGELTASLAHEINQPIAAAAASALACVQWLRHETPDIAEASAAASKIARDVRRASDIIERVRSLYRGDTAKRDPVNVNEIIQDMIVLLRDAADRNSISIRTKLDLGLPMIAADRVQLQQVLMNLMLNGIDAMKDTRGDLTVTSRRTEDGQILIAVSDSSAGLPVDWRELLFEAFFTTKPQVPAWDCASVAGLSSRTEAACGRATTQSVERHFSSHYPAKQIRPHLPPREARPPAIR